MISDEALRRYCNGRFGDDDVTSATGLSVRAWRELRKIGAIRTEMEERRGRGYVRSCDSTALKRSAVISTISQTGLSLAVSGHIAYSLPCHVLLYEICDPSRILFDRSAGLDPRTGLPPRVKNPKADWFSPDKPAEPDPENDWLLKIYERRFIGVTYSAKGEPTMFGDLRNDGASFVAWWPYPKRVPRLGPVIRAFASTPQILATVAAWENPIPWSKELDRLGYKYEKHDEDDDPLCLAAQACARNPLFTTTINVTLAIRTALRRVLGMEPTIPRDV